MTGSIDHVAKVRNKFDLPYIYTVFNYSLTFINERRSYYESSKRLRMCGEKSAELIDANSDSIMSKRFKKEYSNEH